MLDHRCSLRLMMALALLAVGLVLGTFRCVEVDAAPNSNAKSTTLASRSPPTRKPPPSPPTRRPPPSPRTRKPPPSPRASPSSARLRPQPRLPSPTPSKLLTVASDSVRLVRAVRLVDGVAGRLEVMVRPTRMFGMSGLPTNGSWFTVCDDASISAYEAQLFCNQLNYTYGRQYYSDGVTTYGAEEPVPPAGNTNPVGNLACTKNGDSSLREIFPSGYVTIPQNNCWMFSQTTCSRQMLSGLTCSNKSFPPSAPLPPVAPAPHPPPPSMKDDVKLVTLEPNLGSSFQLQRVEIRVNGSANGRSGESVWAPLCASSSSSSYMPDTLATTICKQAKGFQISSYRVAGSTNPIRIPTGSPTSPDDFDRSKYTHWVTVVGAKDAYRVQDMVLEVTTKPCASGYMQAISCILLVV